MSGLHVSMSCFFFFSDTMEVMSLLFAFPLSWFFFSAVLAHKSLLPLPLVILLLLSFFMLLETLLFFLLLLSLFSSSQLRKHSGKSPLQCLSLPLPLPFRSSFLLVLSSLLLFSPHACWIVSVNLFELLPVPSFTCASVASLVSLSCRVHLTTRSLSSIPASLSRLSTAQSLR